MKKKIESGKSRGVNWKVVINSFLAIGFLVLTFTVDWMFIIGAVFLIWLNQKELIKKRKA